MKPNIEPFFDPELMLKTMSLAGLRHRFVRSCLAAPVGMASSWLTRAKISRSEIALIERSLLAPAHAGTCRDC